MTGTGDAEDPASGATPPTRTLVRAAQAEITRQLQMPLGPGLYLVATPIGNLGDMTLRALAVLERADVIYCEDTRHSLTLLSHYAIRRPLKPYHEHNAEAERPRALDAIAAGGIVALISDAGTPLISDPGFKLVREAGGRGLSVVALPGASSLLAGLVVSGQPTDTVVFGGFLPVKDMARRERLSELLAVKGTIVVFEAPGRLAKALAAMAELAGDREVVVARELTKKFEEIRRGTAADVRDWAAAGEIKGEIVIVIGPPTVEADVSDETIAAALAQALATHRLKEAARAIADRLGVARTRVYDIGLKLKAGDEA